MVGSPVRVLAGVAGDADNVAEVEEVVDGGLLRGEVVAADVELDATGAVVEVEEAGLCRVRGWP